MNKMINFAAAVIVIISLIGFTYFVYHPVIDPCASRTSPSPHEVDLGPSTCHRAESTNWTGISLSLAVCAFVITVAATRQVQQKKLK